MKDIIKKISDIGLTKNEAKIYYTLLKNGARTASQLSKSLNINRTNIYGILSNLVTKGLCKEIAGKTTRFEAISPLESFENIKENLEEKIKEIEELSKLLFPIYNSAPRSDKIIDFIEILHTKASITQKISEIEKNTKNTIRVFGKFPYLHKPPELTDNSCQKNENVDYKYIFEIDSEGRYKVLGNFYKKKFGAVKVTEHLPIKMIISDEKYIIFSVVNECNNLLTTIFISNSQLGSLMTEIFNLYWQKAKKFE